MSPVLRGGHADTEPLGALVGGLFSFVRGLFSLVGGLFSLVGGLFSLVGGPFSLVGGLVSLVGRLFSLVGDVFSLVGGLVSLVGEPFPFVRGLVPLLGGLRYIPGTLGIHGGCRGPIATGAGSHTWNYALPGRSALHSHAGRSAGYWRSSSSSSCKKSDQNCSTQRS
jgi:hypothetical protein